MGGGSGLDVGAWLATKLARPIAGILDFTTVEVRERLTAPPESPQDVALNAGLRAIAWFMVCGAALTLYAALAAIEDLVDVRTVVTDWGGMPALVAAFAGGLTGLKVLAWYVTDRRWRRAGRVLRRIIMPGNQDLVIALLVVACGIGLYFTDVTP